MQPKSSSTLENTCQGEKGEAAKILLLGKTGAGKSSFVNYFLGKEVAEAGAGRPVTSKLTPYRISGGSYPIEIFDTRGLEAHGADEQVDELMEYVSKRNSSSNVMDWFHTIFYCVSMANRFEEFEARFIRRLQEELCQHVYVIITKCDTASPEKISRMHEAVETMIGTSDRIEMFDVVSVSRKKRSGETVEARGLEAVRARVFDLFAEDIAFRLSEHYAKTMAHGMAEAIDCSLDILDDFWRREVWFFPVLGELIQGDVGRGEFGRKAERAFERMGAEFQTRQENIKGQLANVLEPAGKLYASYRGTVQGQHIADGAALELEDVLNAFGGIEIDRGAFIKALVPTLGKYLDEEGSLDVDEDDFGKMFAAAFSGIGDLLWVRKNFKSGTDNIRAQLKCSVPTEEQVQQLAYERILSYLRPDRLVPVQRPGGS